MFGSSTCQTSHLCQYLINTSTYIWCHHVIVLSVDTCHLMYPMMGIQICAVTFSSCFKPDFISYCTERMQSRIPFSVIWFTIFFLFHKCCHSCLLSFCPKICILSIHNHVLIISLSYIWQIAESDTQNWVGFQHPYWICLYQFAFMLYDQSYYSNIPFIDWTELSQKLSLLKHDILIKLKCNLVIQ